MAGQVILTKEAERTILQSALDEYSCCLVAIKGTGTIVTFSMFLFYLKVECKNVISAIKDCVQLLTCTLGVYWLTNYVHHSPSTLHITKHSILIPAIVFSQQSSDPFNKAY